MTDTMEALLSLHKDIPNSESFLKIDPISKGMSGDDKYRVETKDGRRYLLRVSAIESYDRKKAMYDMMGFVASQGVSMSLPVDFGVCNGGKQV
jgi:serine/threonine-protein kinase